MTTLFYAEIDHPCGLCEVVGPTLAMYAKEADAQGYAVLDVYWRKDPGWTRWQHEKQDPTAPPFVAIVRADAMKRVTKTAPIELPEGLWFE